jgi:RimJ/RimL family protein N-acetyltransferase
MAVPTSQLTSAAAPGATIRALLEQDPVWGAYALADLQPHMAPYCTWYLAEDAQGLALIYSGLSIPTLFTFGRVESVAAAIRQIDLPPRVYMTVREEHFSEVDRFYDFADDYRPMRRMRLPATVNLMQSDRQTARLTAASSEDLRRLYAHGGAFAPDAFDPGQIDDGVFFGLWDDQDGLTAAGGTHIVDWTAGIAAIGNMYTRPDQRGKGHAAAILSAIVQALRTGGVHTIVLNVDQRNTPAQRLYERYGFMQHCPYVEGIGTRRVNTEIVNSSRSKEQQTK